MIEKIGIVLWYIALAAMLFTGAKISQKKTWNEENMSFDQTKSFLGFCAVIICRCSTVMVMCFNLICIRLTRFNGTICHLRISIRYNRLLRSG